MRACVRVCVCVGVDGWVVDPEDASMLNQKWKSLSLTEKTRGDGNGMGRLCFSSAIELTFCTIYISSPSSHTLPPFNINLLQDACFLDPFPKISSLLVAYCQKGSFVYCYCILISCVIPTFYKQDKCKTFCGFSCIYNTFLCDACDDVKLSEYVNNCSSSAGNE